MTRLCCVEFTVTLLKAYLKRFNISICNNYQRDQRQICLQERIQKWQENPRKKIQHIKMTKNLNDLILSYCQRNLRKFYISLGKTKIGIMIFLPEFFHVSYSMFEESSSLLYHFFHLVHMNSTSLPTLL